MMLICFVTAATKAGDLKIVETFSTREARVLSKLLPAAAAAPQHRFCSILLSERL